MLSSDMLPALENFIQFGSQHMVQNPRYIEAILDMVRDIFEDGKVGGVDRICGCKLAEASMLSLRGRIDEHIGEFIRLAMNVLSNNELKVKAYRIHLIEMVINSIYYSPVLALSILELNGTTNKFFSMWFANIDNLSRVHDKKLSISAITALLTMPAQNVPQSVQEGWPRLLHGLVKLFQTLPQAEKSKPAPEHSRFRPLTMLVDREEAKNENEFQLNSDYEDEEDEEWGSDVDWTEVEEPEDVKDESAAYLDFLSEEVRLHGDVSNSRGDTNMRIKAAKFSAANEENDDGLEEESLLETPLDSVEPYGMLKQSLMSE